MLMWHKVNPNGNDPVIAVGDNNMGNSRVAVEVSHEGAEQGSTLVVRLAKDEDEGQYLCSMAAQERGSIKHTVKIRGENFHCCGFRS